MLVLNEQMQLILWASPYRVLPKSFPCQYMNHGKLKDVMQLFSLLLLCDMFKCWFMYQQRQVVVQAVHSSAISLGINKILSSLVILVALNMET